jgi:hypothetical protein
MNFQTPHEDCRWIEEVARIDIHVLVAWTNRPPWLRFWPMRGKWYGESIIEVEVITDLGIRGPGTPWIERRSKILN